MTLENSNFWISDRNPDIDIFQVTNVLLKEDTYDVQPRNRNNGKEDFSVHCIVNCICFAFDF